MGNPTLSNEKSLEGNLAIGYSMENSSVKLTASYFHISDYIIGKPDAILLPMTIGVNGIKIYSALPYASIFNASLDAKHKISEHFNFRTQLVYSLGRDNNHNRLPFISPFRYTAALSYKQKFLNCELVVHGNTEQADHAIEYGEDRTAAFAIVNCNAGYLFHLGKYKIQAKAGIENIFDTSYSTFGDWNNIPWAGRNFFFNMVFYN